MGDDSGEFIRRVTDPAVVCEGYPTVPACHLQPLFICGVRTKVIAVAFDTESGLREYLGEAQPEVAIGEVDHTQAARSKTIASATASVVIP